MELNKTVVATLLTIGLTLSACFQEQANKENALEIGAFKIEQPIIPQKEIEWIDTVDWTGVSPEIRNFIKNAYEDRYFNLNDSTEQERSALDTLLLKRWGITFE